jgi:hypothetical protein
VSRPKKQSAEKAGYSIPFYNPPHCSGAFFLALHEPLCCLPRLRALAIYDAPQCDTDGAYKSPGILVGRNMRTNVPRLVWFDRPIMSIA